MSVPADQTPMCDRPPEIVPTAPLEVQEILNKIDSYTIKEIRDLLDYWDLEVGKFYGKHVFLATLRDRVVDLKREARQVKQVVDKPTLESRDDELARLRKLEEKYNNERAEIPTAKSTRPRAKPTVKRVKQPNTRGVRQNKPRKKVIKTSA